MQYLADENRYGHMQFSPCGGSGLRLPRVSLGLWHNFGKTGNYETMRALCATAFDNGITYFDLANNYGPDPGDAEENFGRILRQDLKPYRDELVISTKAGFAMWDGPYGRGGSRKHLLASLDQSLRRMGLDYVDIFYHHCPDEHTPLEESMTALSDAVKSGKALYAGISNYDRNGTERAMQLLRQMRCPFVVNQICYSLFDRQVETDGLKQYALQNGCGLVAYMPLAQGLLTDRYLHGIPVDSRIRTDGRFLKRQMLTPQRLEQIRALDAIARQRGQCLSQMALSWLLSDGAVTSVLIGASKPEQIQENVKCLEHLSFTQEELKQIDRIAPAS